MLQLYFFISLITVSGLILWLFHYIEQSYSEEYRRIKRIRRLYAARSIREQAGISTGTSVESTVNAPDSIRSISGSTNNGKHNGFFQVGDNCA